MPKHRVVWVGPCRRERRLGGLAQDRNIDWPDGTGTLGAFVAEERVQRRLAAILAADVAGYSRLMGANEEGTLAALKAHRQELIDPAVAAHGGRIVKTTGDGMLLAFASAVDAVRCAVEIQREMAARNANTAEDRRIAFRVGVNVGDVILDGDDLYGDGVNVAARLEALAEPGGILISRTARDQVRDRLDIALEDLGEREVKNIARPVRVFRIAVEPPASAAPAMATSPDAPPERPSIAVLPFLNISGDPEQEYFSDGITEDIITDLSKVSALFVIARNSSFAYKGRAAKVPDVCRELGVAHVLEGSVRKAGNRVRVTAQLIDGATRGHVWAERYDRDLTDIFAVQDELTREIVEALKVRLTPDESSRVGAIETHNIEAYDLVLRALEYYNRLTRESNLEARKLLQKALALAPDYARAHALLARSYGLIATLALAEGARDALDLAYEAASRAVALDDTLASGHQARGYVALWRRHFEEARNEIDRALALDPGDADSYRYLAYLECWAGNPDEAIKPAQTAVRHDPHRAVLYFALGLAYYEAGHFDDAALTLQRATTLQADYMPSWAYLGASLVHLGKRDLALEAIGRATEINPRLTLSARDIFPPYRSEARLDRLLADLAAAGLPE